MCTRRYVHNKFISRLCLLRFGEKRLFLCKMDEGGFNLVVGEFGVARILIFDA